MFNNNASLLKARETNLKFHFHPREVKRATDAAQELVTFRLLKLQSRNAGLKCRLGFVKNASCELDSSIIDLVLLLRAIIASSSCS